MLGYGASMSSGLAPQAYRPGRNGYPIYGDTVTHQVKESKETTRKENPSYGGSMRPSSTGCKSPPKPRRRPPKCIREKQKRQALLFSSPFSFDFPVLVHSSAAPQACSGLLPLPARATTPLSAATAPLSTGTTPPPTATTPPPPSTTPPPPATTPPPTATTPPPAATTPPSMVTTPSSKIPAPVPPRQPPRLSSAAPQKPHFLKEQVTGEVLAEVVKQLIFLVQTSSELLLNKCVELFSPQILKLAEEIGKLVKHFDLLQNFLEVSRGM